MFLATSKNKFVPTVQNFHFYGVWKRFGSLSPLFFFFGVLATSICNILPYRFRLLVYNFLGIIFVYKKKKICFFFILFFGYDADETVQYVAFLNSFDVSRL